MTVFIIALDDRYQHADLRTFDLNSLGSYFDVIYVDAVRRFPVLMPTFSSLARGLLSSRSALLHFQFLATGRVRNSGAWYANGRKTLVLG